MFALSLIHRRPDAGSQPAGFDELQDLTDGVDPHPWIDPDLIDHDSPTDLAARVDQFAGAFFHSTWRRRLIDSRGDFGHVARQMRKAGVPLELALAILLTPERPHAQALRALPTPAPAPLAVRKSNKARLEQTFDEDDYATA